MQQKQLIEQLISEGNLEQAISLLDREIELHPEDANLWYMRGRVYWRMGRPRYAIPDFEEAVHLDPASEAAHALEMSRDILDFYNPDMMNP